RRARAVRGPIDLRALEEGHDRAAPVASCAPPRSLAGGGRLGRARARRRPRAPLRARARDVERAPGLPASRVTRYIRTTSETVATVSATAVIRIANRTAANGPFLRRFSTNG